MFYINWRFGKNSIPMHIDVVPNRNSPPAILLREARRQGKKVVKVTLANLFHLSPQRIDILRRALKGELDGLAFRLIEPGSKSATARWAKTHA